MHQRGMAAARALPADGATPTDATPQGDGTGAATAEADSFTRLDPSTIPAELRPYYDSMQADYTRKTQAIAPFRQLSEQTGLDAAGLSQAAELYSALQDPQQLVEFYSELTSALQEQGLTRAEAQVVATQHIQEQQGGYPPVEQGGYVDPEEARIRSMEQRLAGFEQANAAAAEAQRVERMQMNLVAEMNRQEMIVKESHPNWDQEDIDAVYEMSAFYGGDLVTAANRYDEVVSARISKILNGKGQAASNPALAPFTGAAPTTRGMNFGSDLDAAHKAALAAAKQLP